MMQDNNLPIKLPVPNEEKEGVKQQNEALSEAKHDPAVKEALKKENSPSTPEDLSHLHSTIAIGTSGGDQRASENEQKAEE